MIYKADRAPILDDMTAKSGTAAVAEMFCNTGSQNGRAPSAESHVQNDLYIKFIYVIITTHRICTPSTLYIISLIHINELTKT